MHMTEITQNIEKDLTFMVVRQTRKPQSNNDNNNDNDNNNNNNKIIAIMALTTLIILNIFIEISFLKYTTNDDLPF